VAAPHEIIIDAPPMTREVQFNVEIFFPKERAYRLLGDVSPVTRALATEQFDDYVKRVRIFVPRRLVDDLGRLKNFNELLDQAITRTD
ncbi:MAG: HD domain-containing protein, partial [Thermoguttaceae bacterium]